RYKLGELARMAGRPEEALEWSDLALARQRRLRPGANALGVSLTSRGEILLLLGRTDEAQEICREALEVFAVETPDDHPDVASARLCLGAALTLGGDVAKGESMMTAAARALEVKLGDDSSRVRDAKARLASLHPRPSG
ncbi:MAG: tetratricopeptide repeat protein, partial [Acidobacteriota bacterium]